MNELLDIEKLCKMWEECEAPLCPLDSRTIENSYWFADEEVCRSRTHRKDIKWIKTQRKIQKKHVTVDAGCFSVEILKNAQRITAKIQGIDPDNKRSAIFHSLNDALVEEQEANNTSEILQESFVMMD